MKLRSGVERGEESLRGEEIKLRGDKDVRNGEKKTGVFFSVWKPVPGRERRVCFHSRELRKRMGRTRWKSVRLGGTREFLVK